MAQIVGVRYTANFIYALCTQSSLLLNVWLNDEKVFTYTYTSAPSEQYRYYKYQRCYIWYGDSGEGRCRFYTDPYYNDPIPPMGLSGAGFSEWWKANYNNTSPKILEIPQSEYNPTKWYHLKTQIGSGNNGGFRIKTGQKAKVHGSPQTDTSLVYFFNGSPSPLLSVLDVVLPKPVHFIGTSLIAMISDTFIGDNVQSIPQYTFLVKRGAIGIFGDTIINDPKETFFGTMNGTLIEVHNPAYVLLDILANLLKIPMENIEVQTFKDCASVLHTEKLGVSFVINEPTKASDMIANICKIVYGVVNFDKQTEKYSMILFRREIKDKTFTNTFSVLNTKELTITSMSKQKLNNTFVFDYTGLDDDKRPKKTNYTYVNTELFKLHKFTKSDTINLEMINTQEALDTVIQRELKVRTENSLKASFNIPVLHTFIQIGDLIYLKPDIKIEYYVAMRVFSISGDELTSDYFKVEAVEDVYNREDNQPQIPLFFQPPTPTPLPDPFLDVTKMGWAIPPRSEVNTPSVLPFVTYQTTQRPLNTRFRLNSDNFASTEFPESIYTKVVSMVSGSKYGKQIDDTTTITINDEKGQLIPFMLSDREKQENKVLGYCNGLFFSVGLCKSLGGSRYRLSDFFMNVGDSHLSPSVFLTGLDLWLFIKQEDQYHDEFSEFIRPLKDSTTNHQIASYAFNDKEFSQTTNLGVQYDNALIATPYPPQGFQALWSTLYWTPRVRARGAIYKNIDSIVAGTDELLVEGHFLVFRNGNELINTTKSLSMFVQDVGTYCIKSYLAPYFSEAECTTVYFTQPSFAYTLAPKHTTIDPNIMILTSNKNYIPDETVYEAKVDTLPYTPYMTAIETVVEDWRESDNYENQIGFYTDMIVKDVHGLLSDMFFTDEEAQRGKLIGYCEGFFFSVSVCMRIGLDGNRFVLSPLFMNLGESDTYLRSNQAIGKKLWLLYTGDVSNKIDLFDFHLPLPTDELNHVIKYRGTNQYVTSPIMTEQTLYNKRDLATPYPVDNLQAVGFRLQWQSRVRAKGARYRNIDVIVAGEDENLIEGVFKIYKGTVLIGETTDLFFDVTARGTYYVKAEVGSYTSPSVGVEVLAW